MPEQPQHNALLSGGRAARLVHLTLTRAALVSLLLVGCGGGRSGLGQPDDGGGILDDASGSGGSAGTGGGGSAGSGGGTGGGGSAGSAVDASGSGGAAVDAGPLDAAADSGRDGASDGGDADGRDGATADGATTDGASATSCPVTASRGPAVTADACRITATTIDAASICGAGAACPLSAAHTLKCQGYNYGPWLVPSGAAGASILLAGSGAANSSGTASHLFTIGTGTAPRVDDVPGLTTAISALAVDGAGTRTIFAGEMPGVWRVRETAGGWSSDEMTLVAAPDLSLVSAGRAIDDTHAFAAYHNLSDYTPRLVARDGACWRSTQLSAAPVISMGMDVDAMNRPWVAWLAGSAGRPALGLAGPDGTVYAPWTGTMTGDTFSFWDRPAVLAGGLTGQSAFPALATQRPDGLHVITPDAGTAVWTDRVLPGSSRLAYTGNCPPVMSFASTPACRGLTTCTQHGAGALSGFGLVRTSSGRTYAGWIEFQFDATYALMPLGTICGFAAAPVEPVRGGTQPMVAPNCMCLQSPTSVASTVTMAIARVAPNAATPVEAVRRYRLATGSRLPIGAQSALALVMAVRANTLLVVASLGAMPDAELQYFEIDSSALP